MATINWSNAAGGDWATGANWTGGVKPGASATADITQAGTYTVTVDSADTASAVVLGGSKATLAINGGGVLTLGSTFQLTSGALQLNAGGTISGGAISVTGGSAAWKGGEVDGVTYQGTLDLSAASASLLVGGGGLKLTGAGGTGAGLIDLTGQSASLSLSGFQTLNNATLNFGGAGVAMLFENDPSRGAGTLTLGPTLDIEQTGLDVQIDSVTFAGGDMVLNQGTIDAAVNEAQFLINAPTFTNQGIITVANSDFMDVDTVAFNNNAGGQINVVTGGQLLIDPALFTNAGTIRSTGGTVTFEEAFPGTPGVLTGGTYSVGAGAVFKLPTNEVLTTVGATLILSGAGSMMESLQTATNTEAAVDATLTTVSASGVLQVLAGRILNAVKLTANAGAVDIEGGAIFGVQKSVANTGAIAVESTGSITDLRILAAGATLSGGGKVVLSGSLASIIGSAAAATLTNADNTISGVGRVGVNRLTIDNEASGLIEASGAGSLTVETSGEVLTNAGKLEAVAGGVLVLENTTINQSAGGTIVAATGASVDLDDVIVQGGRLSSTGTGQINVNVAGGELDGSASKLTLAGVVRVINGSNLILNGAITNSGTIDALGGTKFADLIVGASGATLSGAGQVSLSDNAGNRIYGQSATDTLTNVSETISGAGQLGNGELILVNKTAGVIEANQALVLVVNTGADTIVNAGLIESLGAGGLTVQSAVANTGTLEAAGGVLTVDGAVTGTGSVLISGGAKADFAAAFSENVTFAAGGGVLELAQSAADAGTITGFSTTATTTLDLGDITFGAGTKSSYSGNTASGALTVTDGTHTARIKLTGNYIGSTWILAGDGHGGTTVVDPAPPLVAAMAGFGASGAASAPGRTVFAPPPVLAHPGHHSAHAAD